MKAIAAPTALRPLPAAVRSRSLLARAAARPAVARPVCAAAAQAAQSVTVQFSLKHKVHFGQEVLLVGSADQLGAWTLDGAAPMAWSEGDVWTASVELPAGAELEYKFVVKDRKHPPAWERCYNRTLVVDASAAALQGCWEKELLPVGVAVSYDADDEEEQQAAALTAAPAQEAAAQAAFAAATAAAKEVKLSPQAEAAVGGIIEQAEAEAAKVAADLAAATKVATAELVAAAAPAAAAAAKAVAAIKAKRTVPAKPAVEAAAAAPPAARAEEPAAPVSAVPLTEQLGFAAKRRAASKPKRGGAAPAAKPAAARPASSASGKDAEKKYSPQQLEFLRRSGKL